MNLRSAAFVLGLPVALLALAGCAEKSPLRPVDSGPVSGVPQSGPPQYEPAYYDGSTVTINAIEMRQQNAPLHAQADFYEVVYPIGWEGLGVPRPQCNPCDHEGNGIDFTDYHDHILDSIPSSPGGGEYRTLWHVFVVVPAYNHDPAHDAQLTTAYASYLPLTSEEAIDNMLAQTLPDGSPIGIEVDTHFYFLCAVVNQHAVH